MKSTIPLAPRGYTKNFSRQLEEELQANRNAVKPPVHFLELSQLSGVPGSTLSRIRRGIQKFVRAEDLEAIINGVSASPAVRARLMAAWLRDQCPSGLDGLVEINLRKGKLTKETLFNPEVQEAFEYLRRLRKGDLEALILHTARLAGFQADRYRG